MASALSPRMLGSSGIEVSGLSLGSWRTYERLPDAVGVAIMRTAAELGITFFDDARYNDETGTAPIPTGHSEIVFGRLFRATGLHRDQAVIANKLWWEFWPEQSAAAELDGSLQRMGLDHVDLIYASPPPDGMPVDELVAQVGGLMAAGKARAWGFLNMPAEVFSAATTAAVTQGVAPPCAAQLPYSVTRRSPVEDRDVLQSLGAAGAGVVASFCLEGGILSGKYRLTRDVAGRAAQTLDQPRVAPALVAAASLADLAERLGTTSAALALAFAMSGPAVCSVLFGATSPDQVRANCAAAEVAAGLTDDDLAALRQIGAHDSGS